MPAADIQRIAVVVPACNEEQLLGRALDAISIAAEAVEVPVEVVVVANGCSDRTSEIAAGLGAHVIVEPERNVGLARSIGAAWAARHGDDGLWIATTDADSAVPVHWLSAQLRTAASGFDVFLGTVTLDAADHARHHLWVERYLRNHDHVHGANLGVRATSYRLAGGFAPVVAHEDVALVDRLREVGAKLDWATDAAVLTSARLDSRAPDGVGVDLARETV